MSVFRIFLPSQPHSLVVNYVEIFTDYSVKTALRSFAEN